MDFILLYNSTQLFIRLSCMRELIENWFIIYLLLILSLSECHSRRHLCDWIQTNNTKHCNRLKSLLKIKAKTTNKIWQVLF